MVVRIAASHISQCADEAAASDLWASMHKVIGASCIRAKSHKNQIEETRQKEKKGESFSCLFAKMYYDSLQFPLLLQCTECRGEDNKLYSYFILQAAYCRLTL